MLQVWVTLNITQILVLVADSHAYHDLVIPIPDRILVTDGDHGVQDIQEPLYTGSSSKVMVGLTGIPVLHITSHSDRISH